MELKDLLAPERIVELASREKLDALREIVSVAARSDAVSDPAGLERAVLEREEILSTGIGFGVAVPHAKIPTVRRFIGAIGISRAGIPYDALDGEPVRMLILIAGPSGDNRTYLGLLSKIVRVVRRPESLERLFTAAVPEGVLEVFRESPLG
jgi:PTS system nitrogen regulatory IIA component